MVFATICSNYLRSNHSLDFVSTLLNESDSKYLEKGFGERILQDLLNLPFGFFKVKVLHKVGIFVGFTVVQKVPSDVTATVFFIAV